MVSGIIPERAKGICARSLSLFPRWLLLPGWRSGWSRKIVLEEAELAALPGDLLDVELAAVLFLTKELKVPASARANLTEVVNIAVRQSFPGGGRNLVWRYQVTHRSGNELAVKIFFLKKSFLAGIEAQAQNAGAILRLVRISGNRALAPLIDHRKSTDRPVRLWGGVMAALAATVILWVAWGEFKETQTLQNRLLELQKREMNLTDQALKIRETLDQNNAEFSRIDDDIRVFENDHGRLQMLLDLTDVLEDTTWISEASLFHGRVQLSGFTSEDVPALLSRMKALPWVAKADLDGPVSFDSFARKSRFEFLIHTSATTGADG